MDSRQDLGYNEANKRAALPNGAKTRLRKGGKDLEEEISLVEIGAVLLKHWKLLFFLPLLAAFITYAVSSYFFTPQYESTSTLIVLPFTEQMEGSGVIRHDVASTRQVVQSVKEMTLRVDTMTRVIGDLNLPYTATELRNKVEIDVADVTTISVVDYSPERAQTINNHVTFVLMEYITDTARLENVEILNSANLPREPVNDRTLLNMAVALVLALMVSVALAFLFEHLDNTIKTAEDAQKYLGVQVLGVIPEFEEGSRR